MFDWKWDKPEKHIEKIALDFVEKAYPGIDTPVVMHIKVEKRLFTRRVIFFNVLICSTFGGEVVTIRVKATIQIACLEIPGSTR